mgnify:FL=1
MKKLQSTFYALVILLGLTSVSNVFAGNVSIGVVASSLGVDGSGSETDRLTATGANVADTSTRSKSVDETTITGSLYAEFTSETRFPVTFGFEYTPVTANISDKISRTDTETSQTGQTAATSVSSTRSAEADATNFATLYAELGVWGPLYVRAGLSNMDIDYTTTSTGTNGGAYSEALSVSGMNLGIGIRGTLDSGLVWKLSYEDTDYDDINLRSTGNSVAANSNAINADVDTTAFRLSLGKTF